MDKLWIALPVALVVVVMNVAAYCLMRRDKLAAKNNAWRVPEKTLFIVTACFGGLGGVLGMRLLRHKTQHWYFKIFFPALMAVQLVLLAVGAYYLFFV